LKLGGCNISHNSLGLDAKKEQVITGGIDKKGGGINKCMGSNNQDTFTAQRLKVSERMVSEELSRIVCPSQSYPLGPGVKEVWSDNRQTHMNN